MKAPRKGNRSKRKKSASYGIIAIGGVFTLSIGKNKEKYAAEAFIFPLSD